MANYTVDQLCEEGPQFAMAMEVMDPVNHGAKMTGGDGADAVVVWPK